MSEERSTPPESGFNKTVLQVLGSLYQKLRQNKKLPHLKVNNDAVTLLSGNRELAYGSGFIQWELSVPEVGGVVLGMGVLGTVNDIKIILGLGTNLRNTKYHRENLLKGL